MRTAIYSGTFDPPTNGHLSVLERGAKLFDQVIIAVARVNYKDTLFTTEERVALIEEATRHIPNTSTEIFDGLLVDFALQREAVAILRGLRVISDFEYEMQMASFNKHLATDIETVFLTADSKYSFVSSSMIRNIAELDGDISRFVPPGVVLALKEKFGFINK